MATWVGTWPQAHLERYESVQFPRFAAANVQTSVELRSKGFTVIPPTPIRPHAPANTSKARAAIANALATSSSPPRLRLRSRRRSALKGCARVWVRLSVGVNGFGFG